MHRPPTRAVLLASLLALSACRSEPPWAEGLREGGALTPEQRARYHYDTDLLPEDAGLSTQLSPDVVETREGRLRKLVSYTRVYDIDDFYKAMVGPSSNLLVPLPGDASDPEPELLWIKGIAVEVVDEAGKPLSQEYTCHLVAAITDTRAHDAALGVVSDDSRFTALAQGFYHKEYPEGFGLPALSGDVIGFNSQVLNYNTPVASDPLRLRHRVVTLFLADRDSRLPMQAITNTFAQASVLLEGQEGDGYFGVRSPEAEIHGESCAMGVRADSGAPVVVDAYGRKFSPHWVVDPGPSTNHSLVTKVMNVRYDTTIHTIDVHLHAFGQWAELRDLTTGETVFRAEAEQLGRGIGLSRVQSYASARGLPVYADHEYALVSAYDNTSGATQDAMAIFYLGLRDRDFDPSAYRDPALRAARRQEIQLAEIARRRRAAEADPEDPAARFDLGLALYGRGDLEAAEAQFAAAAQLDPANARAQGALRRTRAALEELRGTSQGSPAREPAAGDS